MSLLTGTEVSTVQVTLAVAAAGIALTLLASVAVFAIRRAGAREISGGLWGSGLVLAGVLLAALQFDTRTHDLGAERRAVEARAADLTARAIAPGSVLACLDAVASEPVETACERLLFGSPDGIAAALSYVDAQLSLLAASAALAERDPAYGPAAERLRRGLEADRFGMVAHVLATRGCNAPDCPDLRMLRDSRQVVSNMKDRTFMAHVAAHTLTWGAAGAAVARSTETAAPPVTTGISPLATTATAGKPAAAGPKRYDYPSASSIPAISIMEAEAPPAAAVNAKKPAPAHGARREPPAP